MKIILGSSSKPRRKILEENGFQFEVVVPDIDEKAIRTEDYYDLPEKLSNAKLDAVSKKISEEAIIITADQVVVCDNCLHEKPSSEAEAREFFKKYSKSIPVDVVSGIAVKNTKNGKRISGKEIVTVIYNPIPQSVVDEYIATGDPYIRAGGFAIAHDILKPYVKEVRGTVDSVMGLPMDLLKGFINEVNEI